MKKTRRYSERLSTPNRIAGSLAICTAIAIAWEVIVRAIDVPKYLLPPPSEILKALFTFRDVLLQNAAITAWEAFLGLAITILVGVGLALVFQTYSKIDELAQPIIAGTQSFPKEALAPLLVVWFGFGIASKIVLASAIAFFPVFLGTLRGLKSVPHDVLYTLTALRASPSQILWGCRVRYALPHFFSGLRVASTLAIVGAVIGEFMGSSGGLGHLLLSANAQFSVALVFACLVVLAGMGIFTDTLLGYFERKMIGWHESVSEIKYITN